jgi:O-antigen ligase
LNELANVAGTEGHLSYQSRFQDLLSLGSDERYSSIEIRMELNRENWEKFLSSPLIGIGYMNSYLTNLYGLVNHNDWLLLLADTGIVGFGLFAAILGWISLQAWRLRGHDWWVIHGNLGAMAGIITSLFFIDAYTTVFLWVILAMILVSGETEQLADTKRYIMSQNLVWSHAGTQL